MINRLCATLGICLLLALVLSAGAFAQEPDPADQVKSFLTAKGYTVSEVNYFPDQQGNPRPDAVYVLMDAVSGNLDSNETAAQVVWGFFSLRKSFARADFLTSVLAYKRFALFFSSSSAIFDKYLKEAIGKDAFWNGVRRTVRIYDLVRKSYIDEKDFISNSQTDKNFGTTPPNPAPTPIPPSPAKGGTLRLEPSTTYLPADDKTNVTLIATLLDANFIPLANQTLSFSHEAPGHNAQTIDAQSTDANGNARANTKGSLDIESLLLRVSTESLNSQVSIAVGPLVTNKSEQIDAVVKGLTEQGYADVDAGYFSRTGPTGEVLNTAIVEMRMATQTLDRAFYSQLSRGFGTLRTVFPKSNSLLVIVIYRKDGRDWSLYWKAQTANWDQFVVGKISENDFWRYLEYVGAFDEDGNRLEDKNFMDKNFGAGSGKKEARITRSLESSMTKEKWGDQWHAQEFVVLPGSYADTFTLADLSGNATAIQIFQSPEFRTPFLEFKRVDSQDAPKKWRLSQGQYLFAIMAPSAPAAARMTYVEHLPQ